MFWATSHRHGLLYCVALLRTRRVCDPQQRQRQRSAPSASPVSERCPAGIGDGIPSNSYRGGACMHHGHGPYGAAGTPCVRLALPQ